MVASTPPQSAQSRVTAQEGVATDSQHRRVAPGESTGTLRVPQPRQDDSSSSSDSDDNAQHNFGDPTNAEPGGLFDTNVESIITKIQQVKFGEDVPLGHTRRVPKGFNLRAVIDHANYEAGTKLLKERERQRKALGLPVTTSRRRRLKHGFDPKQVIRKHALSAANGYPHQYNTLTNDIHPLLDHERFVDCPLEVYDVLKPALRLASVWLLHRATSTYWQTLAWGTRTVCKELFAPGGAPIERIRDDVSWSSGNAERFQKYLLDIAKNVRIQFDTIIPESHVYGTLTIPCHIARRALPLDQYSSHRSIIDLHIDFYTTAMRLSLLRSNANPAMVMRFNFFLAVNIVHEIAHFFEMSHNYPKPEASMNNNMFNEAGAAWELKMFGGRVHPISGRMDCAYGLATYDWPEKAFEDKDDNILYTVSMEYIAWHQQQSTWEEDYTDKDWKVFHIPRTGARSVGHNALNMTIWEDEEAAPLSDDLPGNEDTPLKRTQDGRILKAEAVQGFKAKAQRPSSRAIYGSPSAARRFERAKSAKQIKKERKTALKDALQKHDEDALME